MFHHPLTMRLRRIWARGIHTHTHAHTHTHMHMLMHMHMRMHICMHMRMHVYFRHVRMHPTATPTTCRTVEGRPGRQAPVGGGGILPWRSELRRSDYATAPEQYSPTREHPGLMAESDLLPG